MPTNGTVIITSEYFNAVYCNGRLQQDGKPEYLDPETLLRLYPSAVYYTMDQRLYDEILDGMGYPTDINDLPAHRLTLIH